MTVKDNNRRGAFAFNPKATIDFLASLGSEVRFLSPISERDYVGIALKMANWSGDDYQEYCDLETSLMMSARSVVRDPDSVAPPDELVSSEALAGWTGRKRAEFFRDDLREMLGRIVDGIDPHRELLAAPLIRPGYMVALPVASVADGQLSINFIYMPLSLERAFTFVRALLVAHNKEFGRELRRCQSTRCNNFFLAPQGRTGAPRKYCQDACMEKVHRDRVSLRVNASRNGMPVRDWEAKQKRRVKKQEPKEK